MRVRFDKKKGVELNVADLRKTGNDDLVRLAEADRKESNTLYARGNDDGWLTTKEVDNAVGIHLSIIGGYDKLIEEAAKRGATHLPAKDVAALMLAGRDGPVRKRDVKIPKAQPDPVLHAENYDPKAFANATSPTLLADLETKIDTTIDKAGSAKRPVYRGFALDQYGGPELIRYLKGDWRCMIATHTFTKELTKRLEGGAEFHRALRDTASQIANAVVTDIEKDGYREWTIAQSRATQIGVADKSATGMATYIHSPLDGACRSPTSFGYAKTGYLGLIHDRVLAKDHPMIMIETAQQFPAAKFEGDEYYIASHVPPASIQRFFLGFSTWNDAFLFERPPTDKDTWYQVNVTKRDAEGRPTEFEVTPMKQTAGGVINGNGERWAEAGPTFSTSMNEKAREGWLAKHPLMRATIEAM